MLMMFSFLFLIMSLVACSTAEKSVNEKIVSNDSTKVEIVSPSFYQEKFLNDIFFFGRGNEPFWTLEIYSQDKIIFSEMNELYVVAFNYKEGKSNRENEIIISAQSDKGEIVVSILRDSCQDNMSGEIFDYQVKVIIKEKSIPEKIFNGCGKYLYDNRLNDIWVMEELDGVKLRKENLMKGLPIFEFNLQEKKFSGHAGCNQIYSSVDVKGNLISFGNLVSTKMACPDMTVEQKVIHLLNNGTFTYKIEELKLILESESGIKMIFRKTD